MNRNKRSLVLFFLLISIAGIKSAGYGQSSDLIKQINTKLSSGEITISQVLTDTTWLSLHSLTAFRETIKQNAKAEKINLTTSVEPGVKINVKGILLDKNGKPLTDKLVYVYQTSSEGWYSDTAPHILMNEGDRGHARLFGYFKTDSKGKFEFETIKPKGYPKSDLPAHIHIEIKMDEGRSYISELLFDDDPRLVGEIRTRSVNEKFIIAKNTGTNEQPVYYYEMTDDR